MKEALNVRERTITYRHKCFKKKKKMAGLLERNKIRGGEGFSIPSSIFFRPLSVRKKNLRKDLA